MTTTPPMSPFRFRHIKARWPVAFGITLIFLWGCGDKDTDMSDVSTVGVNHPATETVREVNQMNDSNFVDSAPLCQSDSECDDVGPWRRCIGGQCTIDLTHRTVRISHLTVIEPDGLSAALNTALLNAIEGGQLNLLVHIHDELTWLIQGIESGQLNGQKTFAQSQDLASYCSESVWQCQHDRCKTHFVPDSDGERLHWRVPLPSSAQDDEGRCHSQFLELGAVNMSLEVDLSAVGAENIEHHPVIRLVISARLRPDAAQNFMIDEHATLMDMMPSFADEDGITSEGWPIRIEAVADPTTLDNDHGTAIDSQPQDITDQETLLDGLCREETAIRP